MIRRTAWPIVWVAVCWLLVAPPSFGVDLPLPAAQAPAKIPSDTSELIVFFKPGANVNAFARARGLAVKHALKSDPNAYVLSAGTVAAALADMPVVGADSQVAAAYANQRTQYVLMDFVPNDPYFHKDTPSAGWHGQWHLINEYVSGRDARVQGAWNRDITGLGVVIGICDDCIQTTHPDLQPNYDAADSWDFGQNDPVPDPDPANDATSPDQHGISVAGVAAARGGNGIGVTGAAPYASLAGLRIDFPNQTTEMFVDATLYHSSGSNTTIKVKNHSYGYTSPYIPTSADVIALQTSAAAGTIHCVAAGNNRSSFPNARDANTLDLQNSPECICVAAISSNGTYASYSSFGACLAVCAPSSGSYAITTTDRMGESYGYNGSGDSFPDPDYTSKFGGTSSATPVVTGVMALVKQVQPALDVRFAKHLLARTSTIVDAGDSTTASDGGWRTNAAGYHFNQNYGFGLIDADELTRQAVLYAGVTPLTTQGTGTVSVDAAIPDNNSTGVTRTFNITSTTPLEEVEVYLNITHPYRGNLEAYLTSPSGYTSRLFLSGSDSGDDINWTFTTNAFWGMNPAGTWSLNVRDVVAPRTGTWNSYSVTARMGELTPLLLSCDFDHDGDVDMADFGHFQRCLTGSGIAQNATDCLDARLDADSDVDADDFAVFNNCFSGPNVPASLECMP